MKKVNKTTKKPPAPVELLIVVVNPAKSGKVFEILHEWEEKNSLAVMGCGTSDSNLLELFGFGIVERTVVMAIINTKNGHEIVHEIATKLQFHTPEFSGVAFTVPVNSMEKSFLKLILEGGK